MNRLEELDSLQELYIDCNFDYVILPKNLKKLTIGPNFSDGVLEFPTELQELNIDSNLKIVSLPMNLKKLYLGPSLKNLKSNHAAMGPLDLIILLVLFLSWLFVVCFG